MGIMGFLQTPWRPRNLLTVSGKLLKEKSPKWLQITEAKNNWPSWAFPAAPAGSGRLLRPPDGLRDGPENMDLGTNSVGNQRNEVKLSMHRAMGLKMPLDTLDLQKL